MTEIGVRDIWYALTLSAVFVALLIFFWVFFTFVVEPWHRRRKISQRLSETSADYLRRVQILKSRFEEKASPLIVVARTLFGRQRLNRFEHLLMQADVYYSPAIIFQVIVFLMIVGFFIGGILFRNPLLGFVFALLLAMLPLLYLWRRKHQKALAVERQMPDAMELLARSLRAGHTLPSAVELLGDELEHPLGTEMKITYEEQRYGLPMQDALMNMIERVDSQDLRYFVTAVLIQQESGGNLAEVLENISHVIRGRLNMKAKIKALTAEGRLSAVGLTLLPIAIFFILLVFRYKVQSIMLTHPTGQKILLIAIVLLLIGSVVMRKIINSVEV